MKKCDYWNCEKLTDKNKRYCSRKCGLIANVVIRRKELKLKAVEYKGGLCVICGYAKCIDALEFHHTEPEHKDFGIGAGGNTKSWEQIKNEIQKCILVCSNCHKEIHFKQKGMAILSEVLNKRKRAETLREKPKTKNKCLECGTITSNDKFCSQYCYKIQQAKNIPTSNELIKLYNKLGSVLAMSKYYNVSDNAIRKWFKKYDLLDMVKRKSRPQNLNGSENYSGM